MKLLPVPQGPVMRQCRCSRTRLAAGQMQEQRSGRDPVACGSRRPQPWRLAAAWRSACVHSNRFLPAERDLLVDQQTEPFGVFEGAAFGIGRDDHAEPLCHAVKAQFAQAIQCWVVQQSRSPQWK